ncbi:hypothetical protein GQ55_9G136900 [Panicum hallii var. hallii]|uniref:Gnk2-homologous domain-containing protein n=1 Tax=Panicum hallii var. hallii TaxID=1504633 RepID=A0A2T7C2U1_9POAL|nr:hypothetical protein GQ55_9G136900 [Panicum hallii var. hallii]
MNLLCNSDNSYALNSTYHSNVVALLGSLSADASNSTVGFATGAAGRGRDQVWGLALCRGDINGTSCASCLALAPGVAFGNCSGVRDVSVYYDRCLLRFSDEDFLASPDDPAAPVQYGLNLEVNITGDPGRFVGLAADLVGALSGWAAHNSTSRYAAGVMTSAQGFTTTEFAVVRNIYGLVQCTPDHAPEACLGCLGRLRDEMPAVFNGTSGAQFNLVWCNLRYEVFLLRQQPGGEARRAAAAGSGGCVWPERREQDKGSRKCIVSSCRRPRCRPSWRPCVHVYRLPPEESSSKAICRRRRRFRVTSL